MTRKDYKKLAWAIGKSQSETKTVLGSGSVLKIAATNLAYELELDNPRFDREKFLKACGF